MRSSLNFDKYLWSDSFFNSKLISRRRSGWSQAVKVHWTLLQAILKALEEHFSQSCQIDSRISRRSKICLFNAAIWRVASNNVSGSSSSVIPFVILQIVFSKYYSPNKPQSWNVVYSLRFMLVEANQTEQRTRVYSNQSSSIIDLEESSSVHRSSRSNLVDRRNCLVKNSSNRSKRCSLAVLPWTCFIDISSIDRRPSIRRCVWFIIVEQSTQLQAFFDLPIDRHVRWASVKSSDRVLGRLASGQCQPEVNCSHHALHV